MGIENIVDNIEIMKMEAADLGLQLNALKSEVICDVNSTSDSLLLSIPVAHIVVPSSATILDSPIGYTASISNALK